MSFRFVTVYHSGALAGQMRDDCGVPDRGVRLAQPDYGSSSDKAMRRRQFLGLPLTWTPTTWIFHNNGQLAYAVDSGEVTEEMTDTLLRALTRRC